MLIEAVKGIKKRKFGDKRDKGMSFDNKMVSANGNIIKGVNRLQYTRQINRRTEQAIKNPLKKILHFPLSFLLLRKVVSDTLKTIKVALVLVYKE